MIDSKATLSLRGPLRQNCTLLACGFEFMLVHIKIQIELHYITYIHTNNVVQLPGTYRKRSILIVNFLNHIRMLLFLSI
jgi:hypothetical protein